MALFDLISAFVDREFARETAFLAELAKVPSDNPPGDCAVHAARARVLLEGLGFAVETDSVPPSAVQAVGMKSATNLIVRHRFGEGSTVALNAHGMWFLRGAAGRATLTGQRLKMVPMDR